MNVGAKKGDKVICRCPDSGNLGDQERAKKHLVLGMVYTVERIVVSGYRTDVYLQEVEGVPFNSVQFDNVDGTD